MKRIVVSILLIFLWCSCNRQNKSYAEGGIKGPESAQLATIKAYIDSLWNRHDTTFLAHVSTEGFKRTLNGIPVADSPLEMQSHLNVYFKAFPDLKLTLNQTLLHKGQAYILWHSEGTNTGIFGENPATGKKVKINGMSQLFLNEEGKIYKEQVYYNELDLLQQLGYTLLPPILE